MTCSLLSFLLSATAFKESSLISTQVHRFKIESGLIANVQEVQELDKAVK